MWTCSPHAGFAGSHNWEMKACEFMHLSPGSSKKSKIRIVLVTNTHLPKHLLYAYAEHPKYMMEDTLKNVIRQDYFNFWNHYQKVIFAPQTTWKPCYVIPEQDSLSLPAAKRLGCRYGHRLSFLCPRQMLNWFLQILHYLTRVVNMHDSSASP